MGWSGRKVNIDKSNVYFSKNLRGSKVNDFQAIVEKVQLKLAGRKAQCLFWARRELVAKSIGMSIYTYTLMLVPVPKTT